MGELRDRMYRSMVLGNLSEKTQEAYLYHMREYTRYHQKSPALLNEEHACQYLFHLSEDLARSYSNVNIARCALKYFYKNVLQRDWNENNIIPRTKGERRLPIDLSRQEIKRLLDAVDNPTYRVMLMTIYSAGLRVSEAANLRVFDIDGDRMRIFVKSGKGRKDRYTVLSEIALVELRKYWLIHRPDYWLFPGKKKNKPLVVSTVQSAFQVAKKKPGLTSPLPFIVCATVLPLTHSKMV